MPHISIKFSNKLDATVDMKQVMQACLDEFVAIEIFDMASVEVRASEVPYSLTMQGEVAFVHVKIELFPGRDAQHLTALSKAIFQSVESLVNQPMNISVQMVEMNRQFISHN